MFVTWYYPIRFYRNAAPISTAKERGTVIFLLLWVFFLFITTFRYLIQAAIETAKAIRDTANRLFTFRLVFYR